MSKTWNESPPVSATEESEDDDDKRSFISCRSDDDEFLSVARINHKKIRSSKSIHSSDSEEEFQFEGDYSKVSCD